MTTPLLVGLPLVHHDHHRRIFQGVLDYVRPYRNWALERIWPNDDSLRKLAQRGLAGIIGQLTDPGVAEAVLSLGVPAVNISGQKQLKNVVTVSSDEEMIGQLAANYLAARQLRHYAFVGQARLTFAERRGRGFQRGLVELGCGGQFSELDHDLWPESPTIASGTAPITTWLRDLPKPLGLFCSSDLIAFQLHHVARLAGLDLVRDIVLIGVDNQLDYCEAVHPPFSSVELGMVGFRAAEALERLMNGQIVPRVIDVPPSGVVTRGADGAPPGLPAEVHAVMQLIASRVGEQLQIDDLLQSVPLSRRYVEKRFKQATGRSIYQEVQRQRIDRAAMLLSSTRWPVERVGEASGFPDPRQFSRVFKQYMNTSPVKYRKKQLA
jgi:LacI family transcriptional regulator